MNMWQNANHSSDNKEEKNILVTKTNQDLARLFERLCTLKEKAFNKGEPNNIIEITSMLEIGLSLLNEDLDEMIAKLEQAGVLKHPRATAKGR